MTHPTREQWMSYLHDETNGAESGALQQHLGQCAECRAQLTGWQETRRRLDTWKIAPPPSGIAVAFDWPRWAIAAAAAIVMLASGIALGRSAGPSRAELASLHSEVQELKADFNARQHGTDGAESRTQWLELVANLNDRIVTLQAQQVLLRRELETVAVNTQAGFNQTRNRLVELASASQPEAKQ